MHETAGPVPSCPHRITVLEKRQMSEEVLEAKTNKLFRVTTYPYFSPEGEIIGSIHVARDITEEKERERRLIMSERLAALGQIASGIAHEINNPLASIAGCSEGLLSRVRKGQCDSALFETYLTIIQEEVFRCKSITTAMLSFVRGTTYEKKDVPVNGMLDRTLEIIGFQGRLKNVEIARRYDDGAPVVHGNEGELRQVFLALLTNALDAIHDKGALTLETGTGEGVAIVRITDSGPGIPSDSLAKIFDPFFTTKSEQGGTGLGLSIARKIVLNHNGSLEAASGKGKGATFTITLPAPG
jgi:signal transduction histidine kinase